MKPLRSTYRHAPLWLSGIVCLFALGFVFSALADEAPGINNVLHISNRLLSGSEPVSAEDFSYLTKKGVRTIVSVDGGAPDVEAARALDIRYVHIPIGYDAIPVEAQGAIAKVLRECDGPIFIHCHLGKHRGPAMTAVAGILEGTSTHDEALAFLRRAGTSADYAALWRSVEHFDADAASGIDVALHESYPVQALASEMAAISRIAEHLDTSSKQGWKVPERHDDIAPEHEALILSERFRELRRLGDYRAMEQGLRNSEDLAKALHNSLTSNRLDEADQILQSLKNSCRDCHRAHRN